MRNRREFRSASEKPRLSARPWARQRFRATDYEESLRRPIRSAPQTHTIVDPFCGTGSALATANLLGLNALGVELHRKRAARARALNLPPDALSLLDSPSHGDP